MIKMEIVTGATISWFGWEVEKVQKTTIPRQQQK